MPRAFRCATARAMSFKHKIGNLMLSLAMSVLFFRWVRDSQSGMWVFRRVDPEGDEAGVATAWRFPRRSRSRRCAIRGSVSARSRFMYSSRLGEIKLNPWRDGFQNLCVPAEEALLAMSISAVVPVWNGRELLARLLDTLDAQTLPRRRSAGGGQRVDRRRAGNGARARRARDRDGAQRGLRRRGESRHSRSAREWIAILNSDVELAPDYLEKLTARRARWFATGKILDARRTA